MGRKMLYDINNDPKVLELYNEGKSLNEIAKLLKTHHEVIRRRLVKMDVVIRDRGEAMVQFHYQRRQKERKDNVK